MTIFGVFLMIKTYLGTHWKGGLGMHFRGESCRQILVRGDSRRHQKRALELNKRYSWPPVGLEEGFGRGVQEPDPESVVLSGTG